jgi:hypothetical protein
MKVNSLAIIALLVLASSSLTQPLIVECVPYTEVQLARQTICAVDERATPPPTCNPSFTDPQGISVNESTFRNVYQNTWLNRVANSIRQVAITSLGGIQAIDERINEDVRTINNLGFIDGVLTFNVMCEGGFEGQYISQIEDLHSRTLARIAQNGDSTTAPQFHDFLANYANCETPILAAINPPPIQVSAQDFVNYQIQQFNADTTG